MKHDYLSSTPDFITDHCLCALSSPSSFHDFLISQIHIVHLFKICYRGREAETEKDVSHSLTHSADGHTDQGSAMLTLRPGASSRSPISVWGPRDLGHFALST